MVQMRVVTKLSGIDQVLRDFPDQVDQIKRDVLEEMAKEVALNSPVWGGDYVTNHQIGLRSGSFTASKTGTPFPPRLSESEAETKRQEGYESLLRDISAINIKSENFVVRNRMTYAGIVEGNYGVYAQARKAAAIAVREAVERARRTGR
jgi:formylmethanofuran:tetrahydromethanopterin formyltransferase